MHWCRGCCESLDEAVDCVHTVLCDVLFASISIPALIKWLSIWPCMSGLCRMMLIHNLLPRVLAYLYTAGDGEEDHNKNDLADELLGLMDVDAWHRQERRRTLKCVRWIQNPPTVVFIMVYLVACGPVMRLHYTLFKYASQPALAGERAYVFDLCSKDSVAIKVLTDLSDLLRNRGGHWTNLEKLIGPMNGWTDVVLGKAKRVVTILTSGVYRRLVFPYFTWPYLLVPCADPQAPMNTKIDNSRRLHHVNTCCLDSASLRVRQLSGSAEGVLAARFVAFLHALFNNIVLATSFLECCFAHFKQWMLRANHPMSVSLLQAKHVNSTSKRKLTELRNQLHQQWENPVGEQGATERMKAATKLTRPVWARKRGDSGRQNARHAFMGACIAEKSGGVDELDDLDSTNAFKEASDQWAVASPKAKAASKRQAQQRNALSTAIRRDRLLQVEAPTFDASENPSPWGLGEGHPEFTLHPAKVEQEM